MKQKPELDNPNVFLEPAYARGCVRRWHNAKKRQSSSSTNTYHMMSEGGLWAGMGLLTHTIDVVCILHSMNQLVKGCMICSKRVTDWCIKGSNTVHELDCAVRKSIPKIMRFICCEMRKHA
jgi:hypothetical protein